MGDMADYYNEQIENVQDEDGYDESSHPNAQFNKVCKYCGKGKLQWAYMEKLGWRLYTKDAIHSCAAHPSVSKVTSAKPPKIVKTQHGLAYSESHRDTYESNDNEDRCDWEQSMEFDNR